MHNAVQTQEEYWQGPAGVLVPNSVNMVRCLDRVNWVRKDGSMTEMFSLMSPYTEQEYCAENARNIHSSNYYWKSDIPEGHWLGPADIFVPNSVEVVSSPDRSNHVYSNGQTTKMMSIYPVAEWYTDSQYREIHAEYREGHYYWKN